jgi:DNA-binding CsgD family transcriptional regulator
MLEHLGPDERCWVSQAVARIDRLSPRELDILSRLGASLSIERIAGDLAISERTVENHVAHIYDKLGLVDVPSDLRRQTLLTKASLIHELSRTR